MQYCAGWAGLCRPPGTRSAQCEAKLPRKAPELNDGAHQVQEGCPSLYVCLVGLVPPCLGSLLLKLAFAQSTCSPSARVLADDVIPPRHDVIHHSIHKAGLFWPLTQTMARKANEEGCGRLDAQLLHSLLGMAGGVAGEDDQTAPVGSPGEHAQAGGSCCGSKVAKQLSDGGREL